MTIPIQLLRLSLTADGLSALSADRRPVPLTLALMFQLAQYDSLRWLAVPVSNNGDPLPDLAGAGRAPSRAPLGAPQAPDAP